MKAKENALDIKGAIVTSDCNPPTNKTMSEEKISTAIECPDCDKNGILKQDDTGLYYHCEGCGAEVTTTKSDTMSLTMSEEKESGTHSIRPNLEGLREVRSEEKEKEMIKSVVLEAIDNEFPEFIEGAEIAAERVLELYKASQPETLFSPVESERNWQIEKLKEIFPNEMPQWQKLNGLIQIALNQASLIKKYQKEIDGLKKHQQETSIPGLAFELQQKINTWEIAIELINNGRA